MPDAYPLATAQPYSRATASSKCPVVASADTQGSKTRVPQHTVTRSAQICVESDTQPATTVSWAPPVPQAPDASMGREASITSDGGPTLTQGTPLAVEVDRSGEHSGDDVLAKAHHILRWAMIPLEEGAFIISLTHRGVQRAILVAVGAVVIVWICAVFAFPVMKYYCPQIGGQEVFTGLIFGSMVGYLFRQLRSRFYPVPRHPLLPY
ncbi:hypothetical protein AURDEDRAFT_165524 [Auricularia subglabra TFB-10046 SS5]|nr:hypothetical protein AURDEDRAFT_165524 [Auricularia subglabra TFB-10046 SS5]